MKCHIFKPEEKQLTTGCSGRRPDTDKNGYKQVGQSAGFSLHAGVMAEAHQRQKLERLCRYITRPAVSEQRLSFTSNGKVRYELKTPYRDGTTHVFFEPLDFMARLASLVPKPRINLTRFHGVFAPNSQFRGHVTPAKRGKGGEKKKTAPEDHDLPDMETLRFKQTWMQRLKRVFNIDLELCEHCGKRGEVKVIASIEDPRIIEKILSHLKKKGEYTSQLQMALFPEVRAPRISFQLPKDSSSYPFSLINFHGWTVQTGDSLGLVLGVVEE